MGGGSWWPVVLILVFFIAGSLGLYVGYHKCRQSRKETSHNWEPFSDRSTEKATVSSESEDLLDFDSG